MEKIRRYDLDWLRVFGVLLLIPFHTLIMFNQAPWAIVYVKDEENVPLFNALDGIIHCFHMPLLFIIAGMAMYFSLGVRTPKAFAKERVGKLLVPLLFGCIVLNPIMTYIYFVSKQQNTTFLAHLKTFFTAPVGDFSGITGAFTPAHLWFMLFLFVFSFLCLPLFYELRRQKHKKLCTKLADFFEKPLVITLWIIPIALAKATTILDDKNPVVYILMFMIGYLFMTDARYQMAMNRDKWVYLAFGIILIGIRQGTSNHFAAWSIGEILYTLVESGSELLTVFALIGIANCFINKPSKILAYLSQASFPIYVVHMLLNTIVGFFVVRLPIGAGWKFILIVSITFALCFFTYEIIKRVKLLRMIFAVKVSPKKVLNEVLPYKA